MHGDLRKLRGIGCEAGALAGIAARAKSKRGKKEPPPISPLALEAVQRLDALFDIERQINGLTAKERLAARQERSAPLVEELETWMREARVGHSRHVPVARAMARLCLTGPFGREPLKT